MKSELGTLVELQKTDTLIRQLRENIETADERRAIIEEEFEKHASSIREVQTTRDNAKARRAELEANIAESKTGLDRANRNLKVAKDSQQYEAAMRETDVLNKQVSKYETEILETMETSDGAEKVLEERAEEVTNLESDWEAKQSTFDKALKRDRRKFNKLTKERDAVSAEVTPRLAAVYNRLVTRSRDGIAVAEVIEDACSACYMKLRKQVVVDLKTTEEILTCENCTKILYVTQEEQSEEAVAS